MAGKCGDCTLCCRLLGVVDLPEPKLDGVWCKHCVKGVGCSIYATRPFSCSDFECGWVAAQGSPDKYRPDKLHVIVTGESKELRAFVLHVDPSYPNAYKSRNAQVLIQNMAQVGPHKAFVVCIGEERRIMATTPEEYVRVSEAVRRSKGVLGTVKT